MDTTSIRLALRSLPDHFDRSRITSVLDAIETALLDDGGVHAHTCADSVTITIEVPSQQLVDAAACLKDLGLI
mgnify:CR=1 FL=1